MNVFDAVYLASGIVFIALGLLLIAGRRRDPPAMALSLYVLGLGFMYAARTIWGEFGVMDLVQTLLGFLVAAGLGAFAFLFPSRLEGRGLVDGVVAAGYGVCFVLLLVWLHAQGDDSAWRATLGASDASSFLLVVSFNVIAIVSVAAWILLPLRARRLDATAAKAMRTLGVLAVAYLLVSPGGPFPGIVASARGEAPFGAGVVALLSTLLVMSIWLLSTLGPHARKARNIILILVGLTLGLGALHHVAGDLVVPIGRLFSALVLSYAVVAGQIEGLDIKVRWGISKSTVAAVFITVFFIASEAAQQFFGDQFQSGYLGILAAGALVFAIAPLSRVADRLAEKAVPVAGTAAPTVVTGNTGKEESYRKALRMALRDRKLTREDEAALHEMANDLGISGPRAHALLVEAETEAGRKGRGRFQAA